MAFLYGVLFNMRRLSFTDQTGVHIEQCRFENLFVHDSSGGAVFVNNSNKFSMRVASFVNCGTYDKNHSGGSFRIYAQSSDIKFLCCKFCFAHHAPSGGITVDPHFTQQNTFITTQLPDIAQFDLNFKSNYYMGSGISHLSNFNITNSANRQNGAAYMASMLRGSIFRYINLVNISGNNCIDYYEMENSSYLELSNLLSFRPSSENYSCYFYVSADITITNCIFLPGVSKVFLRSMIYSSVVMRDCFVDFDPTNYSYVTTYNNHFISEATTFTPPLLHTHYCPAAFNPVIPESIFFTSKTTKINVSPVAIAFFLFTQ